MDIRDISEMKGGWFIGDFDPSVFKTEGFEVGYKLHKKGESWDTHYHMIATEINYMIRGKMTIGDETLITGDIFTIYPGEVSDPVFLEDCEIIVVKVPSAKEDKYIV